MRSRSCARIQAPFRMRVDWAYSRARISDILHQELALSRREAPFESESNPMRPNSRAAMCRRNPLKLACAARLFMPITIRLSEKNVRLSEPSHRTSIKTLRGIFSTRRPVDEYPASIQFRHNFPAQHSRSTGMRSRTCSEIILSLIA